jgi:bifunctional non-homologous end joining protein LigD
MAIAYAQDSGRLRFVDHLDFAGANVMARACELGLEGIVSKRVSEPYVSGRTGTWTKAKCRATQHAIIGG